MVTVLAIHAHPDDTEILCAGTLCLLEKAGAEIHIATIANGDKGTTSYSRAEIAEIRKNEAIKSAGIIGATYHPLGLEDIYLFYNRESINRTTSLIRQIRPDLVITASPDDYMLDHEITSLIVQTACFSAGIKNMDISDPVFEPIPHLYYCDPIEGNDKMGRPVIPQFYIDITNEIETKEKMLGSHESQQSWLQSHHDSEYILAMKRFSGKRGEEVGKSYAEGFRQHLGHGYPHDNLLAKILGELVIENNNA